MRKKINWDWGIDFKDITIRSTKTFFQSAIALALASEIGLVKSDTLKTAIVGGLAATLSVIYNTLSQANNNRRSNGQ